MRRKSGVTSVLFVSFLERSTNKGQSSGSPLAGNGVGRSIATEGDGALTTSSQRPESGFSSQTASSLGDASFSGPRAGSRSSIAVTSRSLICPGDGSSIADQQKKSVPSVKTRWDNGLVTQATTSVDASNRHTGQEPIPGKSTCLATTKMEELATGGIPLRVLHLGLGWF